MDTIIDSNGQVVSSGVYGTMMCKCHLSGTPECVLKFQDPSVLQDVSFHPCVRIGRYERDRVMSFVPPDGNFQLMTYKVKARQPTAPLYCKPSVRPLFCGVGSASTATKCVVRCRSHTLRPVARCKSASARSP